MVPELPNSKHEAFAYNVAKGMKKQDAYVHAGYKDSPAAATRLSKQPDVAKRIEELRDEMMTAARAIVESPTPENALTLREMGLTLDWCAQQYKEIYETAKGAGKFGDANAAVKNIQNLIELDGKKGIDPDEDGEEKVSINALERIADVLGKLPSQPELVDITPETPDTVVDMQQLEDMIDADYTDGETPVSEDD